MMTLRGLKQVLREIAEGKQIDIKFFNWKKAKRYLCRGKDLIGRNVKSNVNNDIFSFYNTYEVYEVPSEFNQNKFEGDFILLINNIDKNYLFLCLLKYFVNYQLTIEKLKVIDDAYIYYFGSIKEISMHKQSRNINFDSADKRKLAYSFTSKQIINNLIEMKGKEKNKLILRKNPNLIFKVRKPIF